MANIQDYYYICIDETDYIIDTAIASSGSDELQEGAYAVPEFIQKRTDHLLRRI